MSIVLLIKLIFNFDSTGIVDLPTLMKQLSHHDILGVEYHLKDMVHDSTRAGFRRYQGLQEILLDPKFMMILQAHQHGQPNLVNEFIKQWITKHQNPTWEALVSLLQALGASHAALKIKTIIPTVSPPALEHAASKKND